MEYLTKIILVLAFLIMSTLAIKEGIDASKKPPQVNISQYPGDELMHWCLHGATLEYRGGHYRMICVPVIPPEGISYGHKTVQE